MKVVPRRRSHRLFTALAALSFAACGSETPEPPQGGAGGECDPTASAPCAEGLECTARAAGGNACTYPAGAACQPEDQDVQNGGCSELAECVASEGTTEARCLIVHGAECDPANDHCTNDLTCAELESGGPHCFGEVVFTGEVTDTSDTSPIENAQVIAVDEEGVAVSDVAVTDAAGRYGLSVPVPRHDDGTPVRANFTLRAAAQDYQPFPSGVRVALPIDAAGAEPVDALYVVDSALTDIGLIPLEEGTRASIAGSIVALDGDESGEVGGVLVIATGEAGAFSGVSDKNGDFTIFNVAEGDYQIEAYAADLQVSTESVTLAGEAVEGLLLHQLGGPTATVSGRVEIVDAPGGAVTSVILVVEDTFDADAARGEAPRGLRAPRTGAPNVTGDFAISGVPAGRYVVLAAYENDDLVRDPDTSIAGTGFVRLEVTAGETEIELSESFKVTAALDTIGPGASGPEAVDGKPELVWADDASENWYDVRVFDAFGDEVWNALKLPAVVGSSTAAVQYEGPLEPGMYYQFRVSSWRQAANQPAAPISTTEDLRGVFFLPAN